MPKGIYSREFSPKFPKNEHAIHQAKTLYLGLKAKKYRGMKKSDLETKWADSFAELDKEQTPQLVNQVLEWYVKHIGEEFIPIALSGAVFKFKFSQILRAMETSESGPSETISVRTQKLVENLLTKYAFPVEITTVLSVIVERSRRNWSEFTQNIESLILKDVEVKDSIVLNDREKSFLFKILEQRSPTFVEDWVEYLHLRYGKLQSYTGTPLTLTWKPESKWFLMSFWWKWTQDWTGIPNLFDGLLTKILEKKSD